MPRPLCTSLLALALSLAAGGPMARADFVLGSTLTLTATNAPDSFTTSLDLTPGTVDVDNGALAVTISLFKAGYDSQWIDIDFNTTNGGPLAGNINNAWELSITGYQTDVPAVNPQFYFYWTVNGTAVSTLANPGNFLNVAPNPINPALGSVFLGSYTPPVPLTPTTDNYIYVSPYAYVSNLGIDPSTANGIHFGLLETPQSVPEPSSVVLAGLGLGGLLVYRKMSEARRRG